MKNFIVLFVSKNILLLCSEVINWMNIWYILLLLFHLSPVNCDKCMDTIFKLKHSNIKFCSHKFFYNEKKRQIMKRTDLNIKNNANWDFIWNYFPVGMFVYIFFSDFGRWNKNIQRHKSWHWFIFCFLGQYEIIRYHIGRTSESP